MFLYIRTNIYIYICVCVHMCVYMYDIYIYMCVCVCSKSHCQASKAGYIRALINYLNMTFLKCLFSNHGILTL